MVRRLAILAIGFAIGAASVLWLIGRSMVTRETVPAWRNYIGSAEELARRTPIDSDLPEFDPHLWRERMR